MALPNYGRREASVMLLLKTKGRPVFCESSAMISRPSERGMLRATSLRDTRSILLVLIKFAVRVVSMLPVTGSAPEWML